MNMVRWSRRINEMSLWSPVLRPQRHYTVSEAGLLTGIRAQSSSANFRVKPYVLGEVDQLLVASDEYEADAGVDIKLGPYLLARSRRNLSYRFLPGGSRRPTNQPDSIQSLFPCETRVLSRSLRNASSFSRAREAFKSASPRRAARIVGTCCLSSPDASAFPRTVNRSRSWEGFD